MLNCIHTFSLSHPASGAGMPAPYKKAAWKSFPRRLVGFYQLV